MTQELPYKDLTTPVLTDPQTNELKLWRQADFDLDPTIVEHPEASTFGRLRLKETGELVEQLQCDDDYLYIILEEQAFPVHLIIFHTYMDLIRSRSEH